MPLKDDGRSGGTSSQALRSISGKFGGVPLVRVAAYFANFGLSKAAAFLAPLVLAARLDSGSYGIIEYAWSWSALVATLLTLGIPGAIPQLSLLRRPVPVSDIIALCVAAPGLPLTLAAAIAIAVVHSPSQAIALAACTIALAQVTLTAYCRTFSHRNLALWFEGLSIYAMAAAALCLVVVGQRGFTPLAVTSTAIAAAFVLAAMILFARLRQAEVVIRLRNAAQLGLPLLAFTLSSIWAAVSGRIYIGAFLPIEDLSVYSVDFRVASALLIVHSIVGTGLFARLYRMTSRSYDRFLSAYLAAIALVAVGMVAAFPLLVGVFHFRSIATDDLHAAVGLFPVIMLQVYAWGAWASLEMRLARTRRSAPAARKTIVLMAAIAIVLASLGFAGLLTLRVCAILVALQMLGGVVIQLWTLWRRGAKMPRAIAAIMFGVFSIAICSLIVPGSG